MRIFDPEVKKLSKREIFGNMMCSIDDMVCFVDNVINREQLNKNNGTIYNYVMKNENGLVKIGISKDVSFRKTVLEYASGYRITDVYKIKSVSKASTIESKLHRYFDENKKLGEWFNLDYKKAVEKTKEFSKLSIDENIEKSDESDSIGLLHFMSTLEKDDEGMLDYILISICLSKNDFKPIIELIKIYIDRYITGGGLESYNLFSLYLLLYLKEVYGISKVDLDDNRECFLFGEEIDITDKECNFCDCIDFYRAGYEIEHRK